MIRKHDGSIYGSEIILVTDGEDSGVKKCFSDVINSGSVIHTIVLGQSAAKEIEQFSRETGKILNEPCPNFENNRFFQICINVCKIEILSSHFRFK